MTRLQRFWAKVTQEPDTGCWIWTGALNSCGYASFQFDDGRVGGGHRFAYEKLVGEVPEGMELDHICRVRSCVNPQHLEPVTHAENIRRSPVIGESWKRKARQTHCLRGHAFTAENTLIRSNGTRSCRACDTLRHKMRRQMVSA